jgi:tRNA(Ile2)-agmatinylcytidine synthase
VNGGCTTHVALALVTKLVEKHYQMIGYPRLIRLNPNIPWKTRGNGAISLQVGKGTGEPIKIGEINGRELVAYHNQAAEYSGSDYNVIKCIVKEVVERYAQVDDECTNPGIVLMPEQPGFELYDKAVTEIVPLTDVEFLLQKLDAEYEGYKNRRGLIGATASIAWKPIHDSTYELIAYRKPDRWGTERYVDDASVMLMDKTCATSFDNYDYRNSHNRLVPNSPCPVLFGIRGDNVKGLLQGFSKVKSEPVNGWLLFETNQGTDAHLRRTTIKDIKPYHSVIVEGNVACPPYTREGGHVIFSVEDQTGNIDCAAYEPTKEFRTIVRELCVGDMVAVYGGVRETPLTVNLEKLQVKQLVDVVEKCENPVCPRCGKHMKSKGAKQGYKCRVCGCTEKQPITTEKQRRIQTGFYEVPVCARRHLSKPLKRIEP